MAIRLFRADELPPEIPGAIFTDGEHTVVLLNTRYAGTRSAWLREVVNALLSSLALPLQKAV